MLHAALALFWAFLSPPGDEVDFKELVAIVTRYGVPFPPKEATLVLANTGWTSVVGNHSTSYDPGLYRPAFLLQELPNGRARVLMGWTTTEVESRADHRPATRPFSVEQPPPAPLGYVLEGGSLSMVVTSIQLAQRGDLDRAVQLWKVVAGSEYFRDALLEGTAALRSDPPKLLACGLYQFLYEESLSPGVDLKTVHQRLLDLQKDAKWLFSDNPADFYENRRTLFVRDLGRTVAAPRPEPGSVEDLLVAYGNGGSAMKHLGIFDENNLESARPARAILVKGTAAIPVLSRLQTDQRLTRHVKPAFMRAPEERVRLGTLAQELLHELLGSQTEEAAAAAKEERQEIEFFEKAAVTVQGDQITGFHAGPLFVLGERHPGSLLVLCARIPRDVAKEAHLFDVARRVLGSRLSREEAAHALADLAGRLKGDPRLRYILQTLAQRDPAACVALVRPILRDLPKDVDEPYWTSETAHYSHVLMQLDDVGLWKEFLACARRASVGLRMEFMNPMNYSYVGQKNRDLRMAFLAAFLDDAEVRDMSVDAKRFHGPCAGFTFKTLAVRDLAALILSSFVKVPDRPTEFWTAGEWEKYRGKIRDALKTETLPRLQD